MNEGVGPHLEAALREVALSVSRLRGGPLQPQLIGIYHALAELAQDRLDEQLVYLQYEEAIIKHFYPEDAAKQDAEIARLLTGHNSAPSSLDELLTSDVQH